MNTYVNVHDTADDPIVTKHSTMPGEPGRAPYSSFEVGNVTFYVHDAASLFQLAAEAATAAGELLAAERTHNAREAERKAEVAGVTS